jgi:hypothetical protein
MGIGGHCASYYHAFLKKGAEACGIAPTMIHLVQRFVPFVEEFSKEYHLDEDLVYNNLQITAAKQVFQLKKDNPNRKKAEKHIVDTIKSGQSPTHRSISWALGIDPQPKRLIDPDAIKRKVPRQIILANKKDDVTKLNQWFLSGLTPGQIQQWREFADRKELDNEYAALMYLTAHLKDL